MFVQQNLRGNESAVKNVILQFPEIKSKSGKNEANVVQPKCSSVQSNAMQRYCNAAPNTAECNTTKRKMQNVECNTTKYKTQGNVLPSCSVHCKVAQWRTTTYPRSEVQSNNLDQSPHHV